MQAVVEELIENHRTYVRKLAREISRKLPRHASFDDLVGYGEVGLVEAANNFDPLGGAAFTTFAYYRIRGSIFDGIRQMTGLTPALRKQATQEAGMDQVAQDADVPVGANDDSEANATKVSGAIRRLGAVFLVAQPGSEPLEGVSEEMPDQAVETKELIGKLRGAIAELPDMQAAIIRQFYFEQKTMTQIGQALGKNKATISRNHSKAIETLAQALGP